MEKQYIKKFAYGFSALVLGLSAVNFFPLGSAYAEGEPGSVDGDSSLDGGLDLDGEPNLDGDTNLDDEPVLGNSVPLLGNTNPAGGGDGDGDGDGDGEGLDGNTLDGEGNGGNQGGNVGRLGDPEYTDAAKVMGVGESFEVEVSGTVRVQKYKNLYVRLGEGNDGDTGDEGDDGEDDHLATDDELTIEKTTDGKYVVTAKKAGRYMIVFSGYKMINGVPCVFEHTVNLTVINTTTEAAGTITDIIKEYAEANEIAEKAWREYESGNYSSAEEEEAAYEKYRQTAMGAYEKSEFNEINAFGDSSMEIWEAAYAGKALSTKVVVTALEETNVNEEEKTALLDSLDITFQTDNVKFYDVKVVVYADGEEIGTLKELTNKETVVISGFTNAAAGYKRVFKVLAYHTVLNLDGTSSVKVIEIDDVEFDEATGSIIFGSKDFSTYMVSYKDVFAPSVNTGAFTGESGSASSSSSVATSVIATVVAIAIAGAFKFAKARKN